MIITSYQQAVKYLESFIGKVIFRVNKEFVKEHDPLERMKVLLSLLGNPQDKFKSILVGGTSGKGSTSYLVSHILTKAGYKTGFTLSPHLQKINERLQINNKEISDEKFVEMVNSVIPAIKKMSSLKIGAPSYFEILIAMAFLYFKKQKVDIAVVEVGMGGEYDATNTLYPLVAVLTNISLDHTNVLGGTVQKIAKTKVGIIKGSPRPLNDSSSPEVKQPSILARVNNSKDVSNVALFKSSFRGEARPLNSSHAKAPRELMQDLVVVTGVKQPSVIKIVEDRCRKAGAEVFRIVRDFSYKIRKEGLEGSVFDLISQRDRVKKLNGLILSLLGEHQIENASLAIETVLKLGKFGFKVSEDDIRKALKTAFFPGRFELVYIKGSPRPLNNSSSPVSSQSSNLARANISKTEWKDRSFKSSFRAESRPHNYTLVLDGAHNPTKIKEFLKSLEKIFPKYPPAPIESGPAGGKVFVVGFKFDKDIPKMLKQITKTADKIIITEFNSATDMVISASADALNIKDQILKIKYGGEIIVEKDSKKALKKAVKMKPEFIVVTGSLYLVGEIRNML